MRLKEIVTTGGRRNKGTRTSTSAGSSVLTGRSASDKAGNLHGQIAARAYEFYERRGYQDGHALEDWLHAEREILETVMPANRRISLDQ